MSNRGKIGQPDLKVLLDQVLADFPPVSRKGDDPIQFPRWFFDQGRNEQEIEAVALFTAMLSYGSAKQFIKKIRQIMESCNWNFLDLITGKKWQSFAWPGYRLSTATEIKVFARAIGQVVKNSGCLKKFFLSGYQPEGNIRTGLHALQMEIAHQVEIILEELPRGILHLLPNPVSGGCAKRWNMFLRWMVRRNDGVDMGIWTEVSPQHLIIPLDRHISRISRNLGLTQRNVDDWKTAEEISARLREFAPDDPIKYDFSLCHLGIAGKCTHGKDLELCGKCLLSPACAAACKLK